MYDARATRARQDFLLAQLASATWPCPVVQRVTILRIRTIAAITVGGGNSIADCEAQSCTDVAAIREGGEEKWVEEEEGRWEEGEGARLRVEGESGF